MPEPITYPYARDGEGRLTHVQQASKGASYSCLGCNSRMVARQGVQRRWHFGHLPPEPASCSGESALHLGAKLAIKQGFDLAVEAKLPYSLEWKCPGCGCNRRRDCTKFVRRVSLEASVSDSVRADLLFTTSVGDGRVFALEVVVTHKPGLVTQENYAATGIPVFLVRPTWEALSVYAKGVAANEVLNVSTERCPQCKQAKEESAAKKRWASRLYAELQKQRPVSQPELIPWEYDRYGEKVSYRTLAEIQSHARRLLDLGFQQSKKKPYLFFLKVPMGVVFADFGSTDMISIWEDRTAIVYWRLRGEDWQKRATVRVVRRICKECGVATRLSFHEEAEPDGLFFGKNADDSLFS